MKEFHGELLFEMSVEVDPPLVVGGVAAGHSRIVALRGGTFKGPRLEGTILPVGGDWLMVHPDYAELDARALLKTRDDVLIDMRYRGIAVITPEATARIMSGENLSEDDYYFRTTPVFETASARYGWLNRIVAVGFGRRTPTSVDYSVYELL